MRLLDRPRVPERAADAEDVARLTRAQSAFVTAPTARIVWTSVVPFRSRSPLVEIGTSPTPNAYSIVNWPGAIGSIASSTGSSSSVQLSWFSLRFRTTRYGSGVIAPRAAATARQRLPSP